MRKLFENKIFIFVLLLSFLEPRGVGEMATYIGGIWRLLDFMFSILSLVGLTLTIVVALQESSKPSKIFLWILLYQCLVFISSVLNGNVTVGLLLTFANILGISIITDYYLRTGNALHFLDSFSFVLIALVVLNFMSIIMFPGGIYVDYRNFSANYLFGYKNAHIYTFLPCLAIVAARDQLKYGEYTKRLYFTLLVIIASAFLGRSSSTIVSICILTALILIFNERKIPKWFTVFKVYIVGFVFSILFIFLDFQTRFSSIIELLFNKDATFTNRTIVWAQSLQYIRNHLFLGNGNFNFETSYFRWTVTQAHNQYLDVAVIGGVILLFVFSVIFLKTSNALRRYSDKKITNTFLFVFTAYLVLFITEARRDNTLLYMCIVMANQIGYMFNVQYNESEINEYRKKHRKIRFVLRRR